MLKNDVSLALAFKMPPQKAVEYLRQKGCKIAENWQEILDDSRSKAFSIANMTSVDLLNDTKNTLTKGLKEGWSAQKTQKALRDMYIAKGWWGTKENEKGETVELGSKHRIKTIYRQNIQNAYNAGRWQEQMEDVGIAPNFQYICVLDDSTRPEHRALHGLVFRHDDPFWENFYPPNGWGCRCIVRSLTNKDLSRKGLKLEKSDGKISHKNVVVDKETGQTKIVSSYNFKIGSKNFCVSTDAGFSSNVGKENRDDK